MQAEVIKPNQTFTGPRMERATVLLVPVLVAHEIPLCEYAVEKPAQKSKVDPDPNADLYAAIPWAKDAGLELIEVQNNTWLYVAGDLFYAPRHISKWQKIGVPRNELYGFYPTRESALKSPPPMPPGYVAEKPLLDELAEVAWKASARVPNDVYAFPWKDVALAVARRLLEKEPSENETNKVAAKIYGSTPYGVTVEMADDVAKIALAESRRAQLAALEGKV